MRFSAATEISSVDGAHEELHILGYEIDHHDQDAARHADRLPRGPPAPRRGRSPTAWRSSASRSTAPCSRSARPRACRSAARTSPTPSCSTRPTRSGCSAEGITDKNGFFPEYIVPGAKAFVHRTRPAVADAIEIIHAAGGVAVWAHPFWDIDDPRRSSPRSHASSPAASTASRSSTPPTTRSRRRSCTRLHRARPADDRLGGLPRPRARQLRRLPRLRALRPRAEPRARSAAASGPGRRACRRSRARRAREAAQRQAAVVGEPDRQRRRRADADEDRRARDARLLHELEGQPAGDAEHGLRAAAAARRRSARPITLSIALWRPTSSRTADS